MGLLTLGLLPLLLVLPTAESSLKYKVESRTVRGLYCLNDCDLKTLKCRYDAKNEDDCIPGNVTAPIYYTAQENHKDVPVCLSRCGNFDKDYEWCYVTENFDWDYCSSKTTRQVYKGDNIQSWTVRRKKCIGHCKKNDVKTYKCQWSKNNWDYCAPPALSIYKSPDRNSYAHSRRKRDDMAGWNSAIRAHGAGFVEALANTFEGLQGLQTTNVAVPIESIYRYTVRPGQPRTPNQSGKPQLPIVVRARITSANIKAPNSRTSNNNPTSEIYKNLDLMGSLRGNRENNNDEAGHLIAYMNGGPNKIYSYAPMTRRLNRSTRTGAVISGRSLWATDESEINQWVRKGGIVEQTVVVLYDRYYQGTYNTGHFDQATRPTGFATSIRFFDRNGVFNRDAPEFAFSNNPNE